MIPPGENALEQLPESSQVIETAPTIAPMSNRLLWWELFVVLAIGVVPHLSSAIVFAFHGAAKLPYWLDAMDLTLRSACVMIAVLYVIGRSGEAWSSFGLCRPGLIDVGLGLLLCFVVFALWNLVRDGLPADVVQLESFFFPPGRMTDYLFMVVKHATNGFAEELVTRAYPITRLERLLKSRFQAVTLSAVLFASYHLYYGPGGTLAYILIIGLVYGALYLALRRVWPFALAHMLVNVVIEITA